MTSELPPHSIEAEDAVIAAMMVGAAEEVAVTGLKDADFFREQNRWVYAAALSVHERSGADAVNQISVADALGSRLKAVGGHAYLSKLVANLPTSVGAGEYAEIVRTKAVYRRLITAAAAISRKAHTAEDLTGTLNEAMGLIGDVAVHGIQKSATHVKELLTEIMETPTHEAGVLTGWPELNHLLNGSMRKGELLVMAARPSKGKTAWACTLAAHTLVAGARVLFFSLEMSAREVTTRMLSSISGVDSRHIGQKSCSEADARRVMQAMGILGDTEAWLDATTTGMADIATMAKAHKLRKGVDLVIVDYLQIIESGLKGSNRTGEVTFVSRKLKQMAKELDVPVVALAQLNRLAEGRSDARPYLSDLRDSGAIEQDADVVLFLHDGSKGVVAGIHDVEVLVEKHRNGPTGSVSLRFSPAVSRFEDMKHVDR